MRQTHEGAAKALAITVKQAEWEELDREYNRLGLELEAAKETQTEIERGGMDDYIELITQKMEELQPKIYGLEDWLIDHAAPGWSLIGKRP